MHVLLPVKLTPAERDEKSRALANALYDLELVEERKKDAVAGFKAQADALETTVRDLGRAVRRGEEDREVEVVDEFDVLKRIARRLRKDTGETVGTPRTMSVEEVQEHEQAHLPFGQVGKSAEVAMPDDGAGEPPAEGATVMPTAASGEPPVEPESKKPRKAKASASA